MKRKLLFLALGAVSLLSISCAGPRTYTAPSVAATRASVTSAQSHVSDAQSHAVKATAIARDVHVKITKLVEDKTLTPELHDLAVAANADVDLLQKELIDTQAALASAQKDLADSQANVATLQKGIKKQTETLNKTAADLDKTAKAYHKLKFWVCLLAAAAAFLLLWKFKTILAFLGPYGLYVLVGGPVAVFGLLWLLL